jgi:hypothetical protein
MIVGTSPNAEVSFIDPVSKANLPTFAGGRRAEETFGR